jgi:predicted enzyme related to lactoylglutathione lyase
MPAPTIVSGAPCWIDLYTSDAARAKDFYGRLLGWTTMDPGAEYGGYAIFQSDGKAIGGCMEFMGEGVPDVWTTFLHSDDADRTVAAVREHGGQVVVEPMDVTENGRMAMVVDPGGAGVGIWQPKEVGGFEVRGEVGAPAWFELHTRAYGDSVAFYRDVFGWDAHTAGDTDEFRYTTLGEGESALAGIMDASRFLPEGEPARWHVYFEVEDADATAALAAELGGAVVDEPEDTPYGRLATLTDPTGTRFRLLQG